MTAQDFIDSNLSSALSNATNIISSYRGKVKLQPEEAARLREYQNELDKVAKQIGLKVAQQILDDSAPYLKDIGDATKQLEEASGNLENVKEFLNSAAKLVSLVGKFMIL